MSSDIPKIPIDARDIPADVTDWLGRLVLLYGVPLDYLIPAGKMLPCESIRFFFLDPIWIQYLVQGACSIGNTAYSDTIVDRAMNTLVQPKPAQGRQPGPANQAAAGVRDRLRQEYEDIDLPKQGEDLAWPLTGFLLRSAVVEGWRGLEIMAYQKINPADKLAPVAADLTAEQQQKLAQDSLAPLKPLRIEQLSQDVMLGIFNGLIGQLVVRQPQEGLHFGLTPENQSYTKTLRDSETGRILQGKVIDLSQNNLMRDQENKGVINIAALAAKIKAGVADQLRDGKFTAAEFAVQMIEAPGEFTFQPQYLNLDPPQAESQKRQINHESTKGRRHEKK
jgi:hypothetical protein